MAASQAKARLRSSPPRRLRGTVGWSDVARVSGDTSAAVVDRLTFNATIINTGNQPYRLKTSRTKHNNNIKD